MSLREPIPRLVWHFLMYFVLLVLYYSLVFDPTLYAHHHQAVFLADRAYFQEFLEYPGGLIEWVTQFLFQFFWFNLPGSLMLAAVSLAVLSLSYRVLKELGGVQHPLLLACSPFLLFLMQQSHYGFPLVIGVKYSCTVACLILYARLRSWHMGTGALLSGLIYFTLGGWCLLFSCLLCVVYEVLYSNGRRRYVRAVVGVLACVAYPFLAARFLFLISLREAYLYVVPFELYQPPYLFHPGEPFYLLFLSLPLLLLGHSCYARLIRDRVGGTSLVAGRRGPAAQSALAVLASFGILMASSDWDEKRVAQVDLLAAQTRWQELLPVSREMSDGSREALFHTNRALYHTGHLLDDLFSYPQVYGADGLFLARVAMAGQITMPSSDLYWELGHVKAAQVMAYEGQTRRKYDPRILKRLALTNIISENLSAAGMFLGVLERSILHKGWVGGWRSWLADGGGGRYGDLIQSKRSQMPKSDFFIDRRNPNKDLMNILMEDGHNRMALEYLLAYYLLECRLGDLLGCLKAASLDERALPRHVEEALVLIKASRPEAFEGTSFRVGPSTVERFAEFNCAVSEHMQTGGEEGAKEALVQRFGDTFWYYLRYVRPGQSQSQLKARRINVDVL